MRRPTLHPLAVLAAGLLLAATVGRAAHPSAKPRPRRVAPPDTVWLCGSVTGNYHSHPVVLMATAENPVVELSVSGAARIILRVQRTPCLNPLMHPGGGELP